MPLLIWLREPPLLLLTDEDDPKAFLSDAARAAEGCPLERPLLLKLRGGQGALTSAANVVLVKSANDEEVEQVRRAEEARRAGRMVQPAPIVLGPPPRKSN